jgi:hypothetical protein
VEEVHALLYEDEQLDAMGECPPVSCCAEVLLVELRGFYSCKIVQGEYRAGWK